MGATFTESQIAAVRLLLTQQGMTQERMTALLASGALADVCHKRAYYGNRPALQEALELDVIDLGAAPFVPNGWKVYSHREGPRFKWDPTQLALFFSEEQRAGGRVTSDKLRSDLFRLPILNANLADFLQEDISRLPRDWQIHGEGHNRTGLWIYFWGTIFEGHNGHLFVRRMSWTHWGKGYADEYVPVTEDVLRNCPTPIFKS